MNPPRRLRDAEPGDDERRVLLGTGPLTHARDEATRRRTGARVAKLAATPVFVLVLASWGKALAAAVGVGLVGAVVVGVALPAPKHPPASPATASRAGARRAPQRAALAPQRPVMAHSPASTPVAEGPHEAQAPARPSARPRSEAPREERVADTPLPFASAPAATEAPAAIEAPHARRDAVASEQQLLDRAQESLRSAPAEALARLDEYASAYPTGSLRLEHERLTIEALFATRRLTEARERAEVFLSQHPTSLYAPRVRQLMAREAAASDDAQ